MNVSVVFYFSIGVSRRDRMAVRLLLPMQSLLITSNVVSSNFRTWRGVFTATLCDKN